LKHLLPPPETLTLAEQVAQLIIVRASGYLFDHQIRYPTWEPPNATLKTWLKDLGIGGVILLGGSAGEIALRTQLLQDWAKVPLLLAADIEEGVGQRFAGATWFPPPMALAAIAQQSHSQARNYAHQMGATIAQEAIAIGLNWVIAPVVDVNNNAANPVINVRAFGEEPGIVADLATAFIKGAHPHPVITTAKHFPGHGDTATDSHLSLPVIPHDRDRLDAIELPPFKAAIAAGVDSIMSAHLLIPALDKIYPATLSDRVMTQLLRQELGFEGLIVTDALVMGAIANTYGANEAAVLAIEAGVDLLMMPVDPPGAIQAICAAVEEGRIPADRIQASLERVWHAKQKILSLDVGDGADHPHAWEAQMPIPIQLEQVAQPVALELASAILCDSQHVQGQLQPTTEACRNLIIVDSLLDCDFLHRKAPAIVYPQEFGYQLCWLDAHSSSPSMDSPQEQSPTLLQLFIRGNPFRGSAASTRQAQDWFEWLLSQGKLAGLVIYGSPYIAQQFQAQLPSQIPFGFSYGQMPQAQGILLTALGLNQM
jgi:beta-glucosidase